MNDKVRERIAKYIWERKGSSIEFYKNVLTHQVYLEFADNILADPDIKRGLELLELETEGKLARIAENQDLPESPDEERALDAWSLMKSSPYITYDKKYKQAQQDMINAGFIKVDREAK